MKTQTIKIIALFIFWGMFVGSLKASGLVLEVSGWVTKDENSVRRAQVQFFEGEELVNETRTNRWGHFETELQINKEYLMVVQSEELEKRVIFNTIIESETDQSKDLYFEFIVELHEYEKHHESAFLQHLIMFSHSLNGFIYLAPNVTERLRLDNNNDVNPENMETGICQALLKYS